MPLQSAIRYEGFKVPTDFLVQYFLDRVDDQRDAELTSIKLLTGIDRAVAHMAQRANIKSIGAVYMQDRLHHLIYFYVDNPARENGGPLSRQRRSGLEATGGIPRLRQVIAGFDEDGQPLNNAHVQRMEWTDPAISDAQRSAFEDELCSHLEQRFLDV